MRLRDKIAIVVWAGQSPGEGMGNGRTTVLRFVQEGATVMAVDRDLVSAEKTVAMARQHVSHTPSASRARSDHLSIDEDGHVLAQARPVVQPASNIRNAPREM